MPCHRLKNAYPVADNKELRKDRGLEPGAETSALQLKSWAIFASSLVYPSASASSFAKQNAYFIGFL